MDGIYDGSNGSLHYPGCNRLFLPEIDGFIRSWGMFLRLKLGGISAEADEVRCRWELK